MGKIYCLMTGGMYLHPRACDLLFSTALDMITSRTKTRSIAVEELEMAGEIRTHFGPRTFETVVPRNVRLAEAPSHGVPILQYDIKSRGAEAYLALARELLERER